MSNLIPSSHHDLLGAPVVVMLATMMPDGSPQVTPVWCDRYGNQVWVNSAKGRRKDHNMRERPQVVVAATDPTNPYRWIEVRGEVVEIVEGQPARDHIDKLSHEYFGRSFTTRTPDKQRVIYKINPTKVNVSG